jgi:hypothetical protein
MALTLRAAFRSHDLDQSYITVLHYHSSGPSASLSDFLGGVVGALTTGLRATLHTVGALDECVATTIPDPGSGGLPEQDSLAINLAGTFNPAANDLPDAVCGLVKLKTNVASRRSRGWTYGFPIKSSAQLGGSGEVISSAGTYWTALGTLATGLKGSVIGALTDYDPIVFSHAAYITEAPNWYFGITDAIRSPKPRWLRKRSLIL